MSRWSVQARRLYVSLHLTSDQRGRYRLRGRSLPRPVPPATPDSLFRIRDRERAYHAASARLRQADDSETPSAGRRMRPTSPSRRRRYSSLGVVLQSAPRDSSEACQLRTNAPFRIPVRNTTGPAVGRGAVCDSDRVIVGLYLDRYLMVWMVARSSCNSVTNRSRC